MFSYFQNVKIRPIQKISKIPRGFYSFEELADTPFRDLNFNGFQKAKYWSISNNLINTAFSISNVVCSKYLDTYVINTPDGEETYIGHYKESGQYTFKPKSNYLNAAEVMCFLEDESNYPIKIYYTPKTSDFRSLHEHILSECKNHNNCITNIYEENNTIVYCLKSSCSFMYVKVFYNYSNSITAVMPFSSLGDKDEKMIVLIESLSKYFEEKYSFTW